MKTPGAKSRCAIAPCTAPVFLPGFEEQVPDSLRKLVFGSHASTVLHRRTLDMEVGSADPGFFIDNWSLSSNDPETMEVGEMSWQGAAEFL